jgi:flagellar motor switch protein FliM
MSLASAAAEHLGVPIQIRPAGVGQAIASDLRQDTCRYRLVVSCPTQSEAGIARGMGSESIWLEFTPPLAAAMMNLLMGGDTKRPPSSQRFASDLERALLRPIAQLVAEALVAAWPVPSVKVSLAGGETMDPSVTRYGDDQVLALLSFLVRLPGLGGTMRLAVPAELMESLTLRKTFPDARGQALELSAALPEMNFPAEELGCLGPGDILLSDVPADGLAVVRLAGIPKFVAHLGCWGSHRAIHISGRLSKEFTRKSDENSLSD